MLRRVPLFGETRTDQIVKEWMELNGIDLNLVSEYRIVRSVSGIPQIELVMYFNDGIVEPDGKGN